MNKHKGGRGVKAPYKSKVVRVPEPVLDKVNEFLDEFYNGFPTPIEFVARDVNETIAQARELLEQNKVSKRSTKVVLEKLLHYIYIDDSIKL